MRMLSLSLAAALMLGILPAHPPQSGAERTSAADNPRTDHAVGFFDARLQRVVIIGAPGDPGPGSVDRMWSWSGRRWELMTEAGPPGRVNAGAAYDLRRGRAIVAGGARKSAGSTWEVIADSWEGDRGGWRRIADVSARDHHALVADGSGILMVGGIAADRSAAWPTDTWRLLDAGWRRVATDGPPGRGRTALAYDTRRRQVVLFGGVSAPGPDQAQTFFDDTWIWEGEKWRKTSATGPRGRYAHGMAFDARAGVVVLYGGAAAHSGAPLSDMWQWDGERWTEIPLTGPTPGHRYQPVMVYDPARDRTVLYGGIGGRGDTWEWDRRQWRRIAADAAPGPAEAGHYIATR